MQSSKDIVVILIVSYTNFADRDRSHAGSGSASVEHTTTSRRTASCTLAAAAPDLAIAAVLLHDAAAVLV